MIPSPSLLPLLSVLFAQRVSSKNLKRLLSLASSHAGYILNLLVDVYWCAGAKAAEGIGAAVTVLGGVSVFFPFLQNHASFSSEEAALYYDLVVKLLDAAVANCSGNICGEDIEVLGWLLARIPVEVCGRGLWEAVSRWLGCDACAKVRESLLKEIVVNGSIWKEASVKEEVCNWLCEALQGEDSAWLRSCSIQRIVFELQNGRVINAWCSGLIAMGRSS